MTQETFGNCFNFLRDTMDPGPIYLVLDIDPVHIQDAAKAKAAELDGRLPFTAAVEGISVTP
jgi:hypothetical protein